MDTIALNFKEIEALYNFAKQYQDSFFNIKQDCNSGIGFTTNVIELTSLNKQDITDYNAW